MISHSPGAAIQTSVRTQYDIVRPRLESAILSFWLCDTSGLPTISPIFPHSALSEITSNVFDLDPQSESSKLISAVEMHRLKLMSLHNLYHWWQCNKNAFMHLYGIRLNSLKKGWGGLFPKTHKSRPHAHLWSQVKLILSSNFSSHFLKLEICHYSLPFSVAVLWRCIEPASAWTS